MPRIEMPTNTAKCHYVKILSEQNDIVYFKSIWKFNTMKQRPVWCYDIKHNDIQHDDIQHNNKKRGTQQNDIEHNDRVL
jgi:hypothetical protein